MLRFGVEEIPESGMEVSHDLPRSWVEPLVGPQYFGRDDVVKASFALNRAGHTVIVRGQIAGGLGFVCSRCAEEASLQIDHSFTHVFVEVAARATSVPGEIGEDDDLEVTYYDGDTVDLEPLASEEIVLALPVAPKCSENCRGICQQCGTNLNEGPCACASDVVDPRWARLKELKI